MIIIDKWRGNITKFSLFKFSRYTDTAIEIMHIYRKEGGEGLSTSRIAWAIHATSK
jgi:hypothetical protein